MPAVPPLSFLVHEYGIFDQAGVLKGTADEYYDGSTGEVIVERPLHNDVPVELRQPSTKTSTFLDSALGNDDDGDAFPGWEYPNWRRLDMKATAVRLAHGEDVRRLHAHREMRGCQADGPPDLGGPSRELCGGQPSESDGGM